MAKTKVVLKVNSYPHKSGDEVEVDSSLVDFLVAEGHARRASDAKAEAESLKKAQAES